MITGASRNCIGETSEPRGFAASEKLHSRRATAAGPEPLAPGSTERPTTERLHVLVIAENRLLREALTRMFNKQEKIQVRTSDSSTADCIRALSETRTDILLLSSRRDITEDLEIIRQVRNAMPGVRILVLGTASDEAEFLQCVRAGVSGYLPQDASGEEVLQAIGAVAQGEAVCRGELCGALFRYFEREGSSLPSAAVRRKLGLTRREQQFIPLLARGLTNKEIANHFSLSEQTVKNHLYRMKHKIGAEDRLDIVQLYRVQGFLT